MSIIDRPDPVTVSHEAVAQIARQRAAERADDLLLRDAKIQEQQTYIQHLEARLQELEKNPQTPTSLVVDPLQGDDRPRG